MSTDHRECAVPLVERLRSVPKDARLVIDWPPEQGIGTSYWGIGSMCHEAADALAKAPSAVVEAPADEKHPDWYTWTWDVFMHGGRWRAEYGWEHPPIPDPSGRQIRRNLQPLFTKPQPKVGEIASLRAEAAQLREALGDLLSLYDQRIPLRERPTTWEAARALLAESATTGTTSAERDR